MDESPIPDYLIDMLKESGEIDENGNPVNDFFDPDEDEEFKAQRKQDEEENQVLKPIVMCSTSRRVPRAYCSLVSYHKCLRFS